MAAMTPTVVIGVGNDYRKDDAVGLHVARRLADLALKDVEIVCGVGEGSALLDLWEGRERCFVIDCACSQTSAGTIYRFDAVAEPIPAELFSGASTHNISVADAVALAGAVSRLPRSLIIYGIEGGNFTTGLGLSAEVELAATRTIELILDELQQAVAPKS